MMQRGKGEGPVLSGQAFTGDGEPLGRPYSTSEAVQAAGISTSTLFYYERHGVVRPRRLENGYRVYYLDDLLDLMSCSMLISMGYTVDEAAEELHASANLLDDDHIDAYVARLEYERDCAQAKIDNLNAYRRSVERGPARPELVDCPRWLFFFEADALSGDERARSDRRELMRSVPLSSRGFVFDSFFDETPRYRWARTLRPEHARLFSIDPSRATVYGGVRCVRAFASAHYPAMDETHAARDALRDFLAAERLQAAGDPFVPFLLNDRHTCPMFEIYLPVKPVCECGDA